MSALAPTVTLARRRFELTTRTPRELFVPLLTPILFAAVIAPALKVALHTGSAYEAFVATGTIGLLIPLNTMFSGLSVIVDRETGAQRELLAAPVPRGLLPLGNLAVALLVTAFQVITLIAVALARGIDFHTDAVGIAWFVAAAIAIVPWFLAGSLFPINALPGFLTWFAKFLPLTHGLALVRYGLLRDSSGLHNIWSMGNTTAMAALSLGVVLLFAAALTVVSIRVFTRRALR